MRPAPGEVVHFSEDPTIQTFVPHVAATSASDQALVWAVDDVIAPSYWFPRDCPRVLVWARAGTTRADRDRVLGTGGVERVHAIEHRWLRRMLAVELFAYRLPADKFRPIGAPEPHAWVTAETVRPLGPPQPVGDLLVLHAAAGIELRLLPSLAGFWDVVKGSTLGFSGIRLRKAGTTFDQLRR